MRTTKLLFAVAAAAAVVAVPAHAATVATGQMNVTANILNACTVSTTDMDVSAGNFKAGFTQTGSVGLWCTAGYTVTVAATSANNGKLVGATPSNQINYTMTGLTNSFTGTTATTAAPQSFSLNFAAQNPAADNYSDVVTFTLSA